MEHRLSLLARVMMVATVALVVAIVVRRDELSEERIERTDTIRVGFAIERPYAFLDASGRVTGESPEVAREVLARSGISNIEWLATDFAALIGELQAGRIDMIAAGMFVRPDRSAVVAFTRPSACIEPGLLVVRENPFVLHSLSDIANKQALKLAVLAGSVEQADAQEAGISSGQVVTYASADQAVAALRAGSAHALALSGPTVQYYANANPDFERATPFEGARVVAGCTAFAFRRADSSLRKRVDEVLATFIGSDAHLALVAPFGFTRQSLPVR